MKLNEPLFFEPNIHTALWGTESWEISVHPTGPSRIASGTWAGTSLADCLPDFPLLIKVIDAKTRLSVQVHPNESTVQLTGGAPKTEMWCMLNDGFIYAGLKPGVGPDDIASAVASGRFEELLVRHEAKAGDTFFIPGGLVHAIGDGVRLFEVQQSSDTTFRLYDWNRVGKDGKPRELHVEKSLKAIDYTRPAPTAVTKVDSPFFHFDQQVLQGSRTWGARDDFTAFFAAKGSFTLNGMSVAEGTSVLVPAGVEAVCVADDAKIFVVTR